MPDDGQPCVLDGRVVTMSPSFEVLDRGRVYLRDGRIAAVLPADAPAPAGFEDVGVISTGDTIYPGLIELHNHLAYNVLPLWQVPRRYDNRGEWGGEGDYRKRISGPMGVLGRVGGYIEAVVRYVEVKCLVGGVTTSQGLALYSNNASRRFYQGLVRNVEQTGEPDLPHAGTRIADIEAQDAGGFLERLRSSTCLLLHLSEGVDAKARGHFRTLQIAGRQWAITDALAGIHCAGLRGRDFATLRSRGGTMVWSPLSNLLLYGGTADIARAHREQVTVALGSDWSPSGSKNLLCELKVAWLASQDLQAGLSARDIVAMATVNPARMLKWEGAIGSIEPGKRADLLVVQGRSGDPYEHLIRARETSVTLVVIGGKARYGQPRLMEPFGPGTERLDVGGAARLLDLSEASADPVVGALQLSEARDRLTDGLHRLPELAARLEDRGRDAELAAGELGVTADGEAGSWFLELDHEPLPGFSPRPQLPLDGVPTGVFPQPLAAAPLSQVLEPMELDPLTMADDDRFFDRLAAARNLPAYVARELPPLYGSSSRTPVAQTARPAPAPAAGTQMRLAAFLDRPDTLDRPDRRLLVDQAMVLLGETYVHLSLKQAMHAVQPLQRLRLLRARLSRSDGAAMTDLQFHNELTSIFTSVRDLHTNYLLPSPYRETTAFLPFLVEEYFDDDGAPHYLVTKVAEGHEHATFVPGVEVLYWNGVPTRQAVAAQADRQAGGNPAARFARGLDGLTLRPLVRSLPPDEHWVVVTYRTLDGRELDQRWDWLARSAPAGLGLDPDSAGGAALGYDLQTDAVNQAKKALFARTAFELELERAVGTAADQPVAVGSDDVPTTMPTVFRARPVDTGHGTFGSVRIFTFNVADADAFVDEFVRLAGSLPQDGLIVDVRGNGGGLIYAAERLLQVLTPRPIQPSRAQFVTTPLMLDLCERHTPSPLDPGFDLAAWVPSLRQAVSTGAGYSNAQPITDPASANRIGQTYQGPVLLITDALCYSATDMFAAGFRDHDIGPILGVADNTGAGGANVWSHRLLQTLMDTPHPDGGAFPANPFRDLPHGAGMRVSVRRTIRVGALDGTPLEDLGVEPRDRHRMTRRDVLDGNPDLMAEAGRILAGTPVHRLDFTCAAQPDGSLDLHISSANVDRVDVWFDDRPAGSFDVTGPTTDRRVVPPVPNATRVELAGHLVGQPVARARRTLT